MAATTIRLSETPRLVAAGPTTVLLRLDDQADARRQGEPGVNCYYSTSRGGQRFLTPGDGATVALENPHDRLFVFARGYTQVTV